MVESANLELLWGKEGDVGSVGKNTEVRREPEGYDEAILGHTTAETDNAVLERRNTLLCVEGGKCSSISPRVLGILDSAFGQFHVEGPSRVFEDTRLC